MLLHPSHAKATFAQTYGFQWRNRQQNITCNSISTAKICTCPLKIFLTLRWTMLSQFAKKVNRAIQISVPAGCVPSKSAKFHQRISTLIDSALVLALTKRLFFLMTSMSRAHTRLFEQSSSVVFTRSIRLDWTKGTKNMDERTTMGPFLGYW